MVREVDFRNSIFLSMCVRDYWWLFARIAFLTIPIGQHEVPNVPKDSSIYWIYYAIVISVRPKQNLKRISATFLVSVEKENEILLKINLK